MILYLLNIDYVVHQKSPKLYLKSGIDDNPGTSIAISTTVPLNYNFTFTRVSMCGTTRGLHGKCQKFPWKASFPRDGPWLFHVKTRGISRHVAFPREDTWHFHETSRGISMRPVTVESHMEFSQDQ